jgi:glycosyltransferase involved in cell wall biosynthesis
VTAATTPAPAVTIAIATYNDLHYLPEAVASVLAQTITAWELIIVDDGSTDGTRAWLGTLTDPRIRVIYETHRANTAYTRNLAIASGSAPWIAILDSDDTWHPRKLERQLAFHHEHPEVRWSYTGRALMNAAGARLPDENYRTWLPVSGWIVKEVLVFDAMIATPSMFFARSLWQQLGGFPEAYATASEHLFRIDLAMISQCGAIAEPLVNIRLHTTSWTYRNGTTCAGLADVFDGFAARAPTPELAALSRRLGVTYRVRAADYWFGAGEWGNGMRALMRGIQARPLQRHAFGVAARGLLKLVRQPFTRRKRLEGGSPE